MSGGLSNSESSVLQKEFNDIYVGAEDQALLTLMKTVHDEKDWEKRYDQIYSWSTQWGEMCSKEETRVLKAEFGPTDLLDTIRRAGLTIKKRKSTQTNLMAILISSSMVHTDTDSTKACDPPLETPALTDRKSVV